MLQSHQLISPSYASLQQTLHEQPEGYGQYGRKWTGVVMALAIDYQASSVLDYGCGQGTLKAALIRKGAGHLRIDEYDPGIPNKAGLPVFADLVVCTDVLEHVEPEKLDTVLAHLRMLARKAVLVVVALVPTTKVLEDGRTAHLILRPGNWWRKRFEQAGFTLKRAPAEARKKKSHELTLVLEP